MNGDHVINVETTLDHRRGRRTGLPEVIYGEHKTVEQVASIAAEFVATGGFALATRVSEAKGVDLLTRLPSGRYDAGARCFAVGEFDTPASGRIGVVCAGTSDLPVADEAAFCLSTLGHTVVRANDVGVAGIHRILERIGDLDACDVLIVVAGMEGALPSVVAGLVHPPVIAVPTSVGYGASLGGITALLAMLSACAPGIAVVNIDNGFGAAAVAHKIVLGPRAKTS